MAEEIAVITVPEEPTVSVTVEDEHTLVQVGLPGYRGPKGDAGQDGVAGAESPLIYDPDTKIISHGPHAIDDITGLQDALDVLTDDLAGEIDDRIAGDGDEAALRLAADTAEATARASGDAAEAGARASADTTLAGRIDDDEDRLDALEADSGAQDARLDSLEAADVALDGRLDTLEAVPPSIPLSQKGAPNGVATLGSDGKLPNSQIPSLAIQEAFPVDSEAEMLALAANRGDVALRSDNSKVYILTSDDPTVLEDWIEWLYPGGGVASFNGRIGVVVPASGDYSLAQITGLSAALAAKADQTALDAVEDASIAADAALDSRLDAIEALGSLATDAELAAEAATRAAADTSEAATRLAADNALDARLDAIEGLGSLATDAELAAEAATRAAADTVLSEDIADETDARETADDGLDVRIAALEQAAPPDTAVGTWIKKQPTVAWKTGLTFRIGSGEYYIDGTFYTSTEADVTLTAADATYPRKDAFVLGTDSLPHAIAGTPAPTPAEPSVDLATYAPLNVTADIPAAASAASVTEETIWKEDDADEWNFSQSGGHFAVSTNNPRTGTKCIEITNAVAGDYCELTRDSGSVDVATKDKEVFYIRNKAAWPTKKVLKVSFRTAAGAIIGTEVTVANGQYGLNTALVGSYMQIVIPTTAFSAPAGAAATKLRVAVSGSGASIGGYIDDVVLQAGATSSQTAQQFRWRGDWSSTTAYIANDVVRRNKVPYIALLPSTGVAPETSSGVTWDPMDTEERSFDFTFGDAINAPTANMIAGGRVGHSGKITAIYLDALDGATATCTVDIKKNGTSIFAGGGTKPSIVAGTSYANNGTAAIAGVPDAALRYSKGDTLVTLLESFSGSSKLVECTIHGEEGKN